MYIEGLQSYLNGQELVIYDLHTQTTHTQTQHVDDNGDDGIAHDGVACIRRADGSLVCESISTGVYQVKPAPSSWEGRAFCTMDAATSQQQCVTYCTQTPEGHLVCTGVQEGRYHVTAASDADVEQLVHHIWCTTTYSEDEEEDVGVDVGVHAANLR